MTDEEGYSVESSIAYTKKGRLIELPVEYKEDEEGRVYVRTLEGTYQAAIYQNKLYYIGEPPTEDSPILEVYEEKKEVRELTKDDLEHTPNHYICRIPSDGKVRGIALSVDGEYLLTEFKESSFVVYIENELLEDDPEVKLELWVGEPISLTKDKNEEGYNENTKDE